MELNFTALENIAAGGAQNAPRAAGTCEEAQLPPKGRKTAQSGHRDAGEGIAAINNRLEKHKAELDRAREVYAEHQQAIQRVGGLRAEILKGIRAGEDPANILIQALECISLATGDTAIYRQGKADLEAVHGWGLENPAPLHMQLQEARERLGMLSRPELEELDTDAQRRITAARREHLALTDRLQAAIDRAEKAATTPGKGATFNIDTKARAGV